jgi:hypothetical protein
MRRRGRGMAVRLRPVAAVAGRLGMRVGRRRMGIGLGAVRIGGRVRVRRIRAQHHPGADAGTDADDGKREGNQ